MTTTIDEEKSQARALLRQFASELPNQWAVDGHAAAIMSGEEGIKDHVVGVLEAIHALREEFRALDESHADGDELSSRRWLADAGMEFDEPFDEFDNALAACRYFYLRGDRNVAEVICRFVQAIHDLRDDLIAWGAEDRC